MIKYRLLTVIFGLLLVALTADAQTPSPFAPRVRPTEVAPAGSPRRAPRTTQGTGPATKSIVTWSLLKMAEPELVVSVLKDVKAGKLSADHIATLGSAETKAKLLANAWPERVATSRAAARGLPAKGQREQLATASQWATAASALTGSPDVTPQEVEFLSAWNKEVKSENVWFTANTDGNVVATVPTGAPFRIKRIISYDGTVDEVQTPAGTSQRLKEWDSKSAAPFELSVRAGQQFRVIVQFAPELSSSMSAGKKDGRLEVTGGKWTVRVPLSGKFLGGSFGGVLVQCDDDQLTADTWQGGTTVPTKVKLVNISADARSVVLSAERLPTGVTLEGGSSTHALAVNETKVIDVRFKLSSSTDSPRWRYGFGQPIRLKATSKDNVSTDSIDLNIVEPMTRWEMFRDESDVWFHLSYVLFSSGRSEFSRAVVNDNLVPVKFSFTFALDGRTVANFAGRVGSALGDDTDTFSNSVSFLGDYATAIRKNGTFTWRLESSP